MKKIWILSLLWICVLFTGCFEKVQDCISWEATYTKEINIEEPENLDKDAVLKPTFEWKREICENMIKKDIKSDNYDFKFNSNEWEEDWWYHFIWDVSLDRGKIKIGCYFLANNTSGYVIHDDSFNIDYYIDNRQADFVLLSHYMPDNFAIGSHFPIETIEEWRKTILSYPYNPWDNGQTWISEFWKSPKFKKIIYVWDEQTERDKEYCRLVPWQEKPFDECLEYITDVILTDENWIKKELKNYKIMLWRINDWNLQILASWF